MSQLNPIWIGIVRWGWRWRAIEALLLSCWPDLDGQERLSGLAGFLPDADLKVLAIHVERAGVLRGFGVGVVLLEGRTAIGIIVLHTAFFVFGWLLPIIESEVLRSER